MEWILKELTRLHEEWKEPDDFYLLFQACIGPKDANGSEVFSFEVVSPKRLERIISKSRIEVGRGYLIMNDFDINLVETTVNRLIKISQNNDIDKLINNLSKFFRWEMDTI